MQPGRARTSGLGVPLLLLARWVGWVAPVRPTLGVWFVVPCPYAALGGCACAVSLAPWRLFTGVHVLCVVCAVFVATWRLFTGVRTACGVGGIAGVTPPPSFCYLFVAFFSFVFLLKIEEKGRGHANTTHTWAHRAAVQQCCVARYAVRRLCIPGSRAPGVQLACHSVHGRRLVWVRLCIFLSLG